eukprot:CAMPEP_0177757774 /NCGR_PEP_ID=MMETSP0491_2-20121128/3821_1 /TAXON_ID=63592 /ORGANISM="Tetraselmis chuii, Strain PLY429" /LENGTH=242 /DNA_ID=CAMNT_0019273445 /DNA_START=143 /DNA_END=871 /DNA_ORIENTATION=+
MADISNNGETLVGQVVLPGDRVMKLPESGQIRVGPGLQLDGEYLSSTKAGLAQQTSTGKLWVQGVQKRYIPCKDDLVIGVITDKFGENFTVDLGGPFNALLPMLSFEGATRRNRPNLQAGDVVYCRVDQAHRDMDAILSCVDATGKASGLGHLKGGYLNGCNSLLARRLLSRPPCTVLQELGAALKFEIAVGMNGKVWVDSPSFDVTILVSKAVMQSDSISDGDVHLTVKKLLKSYYQGKGS